MNVVFEGVGKSYGDRWAVRDISLTLRPGIVGLLGPNGAGKTTLMSILSTLVRPSAGRITWDGVDVHSTPEDARAALGYLPQHFGVYPFLTAEEFLEYMAAAKGITGKAAKTRIQDLLGALNLTGVARRPLGTLSGGTLQRVGIAQALLNDPRILIVDEPTAGLDPEERLRFRQLVSDLPGERLVILSTHIVSDIESIASDLVLIRKGRLVAHTTADELVASVSQRVWEFDVRKDQVAEVRNSHLVRAMIHHGENVRVRVLSEGPPGPDSRTVAPTLEDAYLYAVTYE